MLQAFSIKASTMVLWAIDFFHFLTFHVQCGKLCNVSSLSVCKCAHFRCYDRRRLDRHALPNCHLLTLEEFTLMLVLWKEGALALFLLSCKLAALIALAIDAALGCNRSIDDPVVRDVHCILLTPLAMHVAILPIDLY